MRLAVLAPASALPAYTNPGRSTARASAITRRRVTRPRFTAKASLPRSQLLPRRGQPARSVAGVDGAARLDQQHVSSLDGDRLVQDAARDDVHLTWAQLDVAVVHADGQRAAQHEEQLVGLRMAVP